IGADQRFVVELYVAAIISLLLTIDDETRLFQVATTLPFGSIAISGESSLNPNIGPSSCTGVVQLPPICKKLAIIKSPVDLCSLQMTTAKPESFTAQTGFSGSKSKS